MIKPTISTKIFSTLGNEKSLITLGVKDLGTIAGMTAGAYIAGKSVESKDRFMDEVGTSIIWLCGIPAFKWIINNTIYKLAKLNPKIDVRFLENKEVFEKAKKHSSEALKASFEKVEKNQKLFKNMFFAKFIASTLLTLGAYFGLTVFRQKHTEKCVMKEIKEEEKQKKLQEKLAEKKKSKDPNFGLNMNFINQFVFDPVKNTQIIDGGITTQRLAESRNIQDFIGYAIREGGFLVAIYVVSKKIQSYLTEKAATKHQRPIDLDIRVLTDEKFKEAFANGSIKKDLAEFSVKDSDAHIYESLFTKGKNMIVQMAKKTGIITTLKDSDEIDTQSFVDMSEIKDTKDKKGKTIHGIKSKIENLYNEMEKAKKQGKTTEEFFNEVIKLKKSSILKGFGASVGLLGLVIPGIILLSRFLKEGNQEFRVKKELKEKMQREKAIA